ncbi:hypothetical protein IE53DRAFT_389053 [Violaceomyces palustris]|uniref:Uncharacterized protein n=1 Tax=Violaceomyces palustris TaxID=1673888 RepID=A0ACD0NSD2_9BASI|nr:hypothetical protein IE53DRAFT_389053 [Violaceomyces palustris]
MNDSLGAILAIVVLWFVIRFAFGGNGSGGSNQHQRGLNDHLDREAGGLGGLRVREREVPQHMVEAVQALFPQIPEASIRYDLQRTGDPEVTCNKILRDGGLPPPPSGFFASPPSSSNLTRGSLTASGSGDASSSSIGATDPARIGSTSNLADAATRPSRPSSSKTENLISRFGLEKRLREEEGPGDGPAKEEEEEEEEQDGDKIDIKGKSASSSVGRWANTADERQRILRERKEKMILEARRKLLERQKEKAAP